jgi:hypothetical protein
VGAEGERVSKNLFDDPARVPDFKLPPATVSAQSTSIKVDPFLNGAGIVVQDAVEDNALAVIVPLDDRGCVAPITMEQSIQVAKQVVSSELVPTKRWQDAWLIMQRGAEIGIKGLSAFDFIYVVKGRARVTPDCVKALALQSGLLVNFIEELVGEGKDRKAKVTVYRKGIATPLVAEFGWAAAEKAGISTGDNYKKYADRMYLARARGFAFGDAFKDLVGGMQVRETFDRDPSDDERVVSDAPDPLLGDIVNAEVVGETK